MEYSVDAAVLDGWNIMRLLGEGSYGKVFEIERSEFGQTYRAALKVITVPQSSAEVRSVISEGMSVSQAEAYFHGIVEELMHEFSIMFKLKGTANVVSCEDLRGAGRYFYSTTRAKIFFSFKFVTTITTI